MRKNGSLHFPSYNGNGDVSEYIDVNGGIGAHFEYDASGRVVVDNGQSGDFEIRYSTKKIDFETGLCYYGLRYFDPSMARWISRDPLGEEGGVNVYASVRNRMVNSVDVLGLTEAAPPGYGPTNNGQPSGLGGGWKWSPDKNNGRGGKWTKPDGSDASWDGEPKGRGGKCGKPHWDRNDGKGGRDKVDENGEKVTDEEAHPPGKEEPAKDDPGSAKKSGLSPGEIAAGVGAGIAIGVGIAVVPEITIPALLVGAAAH